jgi:hypothetical protein
VDDKEMFSTDAKIEVYLPHVAQDARHELGGTWEESIFFQDNYSSRAFI